MKRFTLVFLFFIAIYGNASAFVMASISANKSNLTASTILQIGEKTPRKLSFKETFALKMVQKRLKKQNPNDTNDTKGESPRSQLGALLFCWFLGVLGIHRFYLGYTFIGIIQLLTLGCLGIWTLIDFILLILGELPDSKGRPLKPL